ncbi:hypothetical protein VDIAB_220085 [Vibrio diabolicus]|nr:hypothetical protein VDIAB_220085 [Vibrio diabolicus]
MHPVPRRAQLSRVVKKSLALFTDEAPWQSGYAADCKSVDLGSTPGGASIILLRVNGFRE